MFFLFRHLRQLILGINFALSLERLSKRPLQALFLLLVVLVSVFLSPFNPAFYIAAEPFS